MSWVVIPACDWFTGGGRNSQTRPRLTSFNEVEWVLCMAEILQLLPQILTVKEILSSNLLPKQWSNSLPTS